MKGEASRPLTREGGARKKKIEIRREKRKTKLHQKMMNGRATKIREKFSAPSRNGQFISLLHGSQPFMPTKRLLETNI